MRPEFRDVVDAVLVGVGDDPVDHDGVVRVAHSAEQRGSRVMAERRDLGGIARALDGLDDVGGAADWLVECSHLPILRRGAEPLGSSAC